MTTENDDIWYTWNNWSSEIRLTQRGCVLLNMSQAELTFSYSRHLKSSQTPITAQRSQTRPPPHPAVIRIRKASYCTSTLFLEAASWRGVNCHRSMALTQAPCWTQTGTCGSLTPLISDRSEPHAVTSLLLTAPVHLIIFNTKHLQQVQIWIKSNPIFAIYFL